MVRVKLIRTLLGYTQAKFADIIGVTRSAVAMWESAGREPDYETVSRISEVFAIPASFLIGSGVFRHWENIFVFKYDFYDKMVSLIPPYLQMPTFCDDKTLHAWIYGCVIHHADDLNFIRWLAFAVLDLKFIPIPDENECAAEVDVAFTDVFLSAISSQYQLQLAAESTSGRSFTLAEGFQMLVDELDEEKKGNPTAFARTKAWCGKFREVKNGFRLSQEAFSLAKDFDICLDSWGKNQVTSVLENEKIRVEEEGRKKRLNEETGSQKVVVFSVPKYSNPMSAGTGEIAGEEYPENMELIKAPPPGTSYIAPIKGNSMEPSFSDGDLVFVSAYPNILVGQIGVFFMDGQQWIKELGDGELISHNPAYAPRPMTEDIICQGRVLGVCDESYFN